MWCCGLAHGCVFKQTKKRINLPHAVRAKYEAMYRCPDDTLLRMSFEERIKVFDPCFGELKKLMRDSFSRFVRTEEYPKCVELLREADAAAVEKALDRNRSFVQEERMIL